MHNDPERTTPLGMTRYAHEFLESALAVDDSLGKRRGHEIVAPIPALYLLGHSIELSLKAYLLLKETPLRDLRGKKFGHSLHSCIRKAKELGLSSVIEFSQQEYGAFELLDELYSTKQLEYIVTGRKYFPVFGLVESFASKLFDSVAKETGYRPAKIA